ncbi:MAG: beta-lactamase family protein, partial [Caldilineaceae bacterium]|nr:beta-lactamase family protein [Caldilineaceae bacterium]
MTIYPQQEWQPISASAAGFDPEKLAAVETALRSQAGTDGRYRVVIVQGGRLVVAWYQGVGCADQLRLASATKSLFSSILGILIDEGTLPSADAPLFDYYPEFMDVPEGTGPKPGRYAYPKDRTITFRQLISNTSGYMKPGEAPGQVFNYQTYGMNILTHALAKLHGDYDSNDPAGSPGLMPLLDEKLRKPIGAQWGYYKANFDLPPQARINIFGYYDGVKASALDMARLGWLWCNWGKWEDTQVIPEAWLREATAVAPA